MTKILATLSEGWSTGDAPTFKAECEHCGRVYVTRQNVARLVARKRCAKCKGRGPGRPFQPGHVHAGPVFRPGHVPWNKGKRRAREIPMRAQPAHVGARGFDCVTVLDPTSAKAMRMHPDLPMAFACRYLGSLITLELSNILGAGLGVMPVTYGNTPMTAEQGAIDVQQLRALGFPPGITCWVDLEGVSGDKGALIDGINRRTYAIQDAGFHAGLYVGAPQPLNAVELYTLPFVTGYWRGLSRDIVAPFERGFQMVQCFPTVVVAGVSVDINFVTQDYKGGLPVWAAAS